MHKKWFWVRNLDDIYRLHKCFSIQLDLLEVIKDGTTVRGVLITTLNFVKTVWICENLINSWNLIISVVLAIEMKKDF